MKFQVLLSCMHNKDFSIIEKSNLQNVNTLIINQCNTSEETCVSDAIHKMINTPTRGLSVSRNLAVQNSDADVVLLSDDDEVFVDNIEKIICDAYKTYLDADIIIFKMINYVSKLGDKARRLKKYEMLRVSSWMISFKVNSVKDKIFFDENLGAGTGNGASEENKFLLDCYKKGLKIYYVPTAIATVSQEQSTWFKGYDERYFYNRGKTNRYILGLPIALFYAVYFLINKRKVIKKEIKLSKAFKYLIKGVFTKDINKQYVSNK